MCLGGCKIVSCVQEFEIVVAKLWEKVTNAHYGKAQIAFNFVF